MCKLEDSIPTAEKLLALLRAGRVSTIKGVSGVEYVKEIDRYQISHDFGVEEASILINTTGSVDREVSSPRQPEFIQNLCESGLLSQYHRDCISLKGAEVNMQRFSLPDAPNIYMANMLLWGPGFFTSSAYTMPTLVEKILSEIFSADH